MDHKLRLLPQLPSYFSIQFILASYERVNTLLNSIYSNKIDKNEKVEFIHRFFVGSRFGMYFLFCFNCIFFIAYLFSLARISRFANLNTPNIKFTSNIYNGRIIWVEMASKQSSSWSEWTGDRQLRHTYPRKATSTKMMIHSSKFCLHLPQIDMRIHIQILKATLAKAKITEVQIQQNAIA